MLGEKERGKLMAEYINRDAFLAKERAWYCDNCDRRKNSKGKTVYEIGEAPCRACDIGDVLDLLEDYPAADVVEVVRCKDCKYCLQTDEFEYWCDGFCSPMRLVRKEDFCSHGEYLNG